MRALRNEKQTLQKANANAMLFRAIDGRFIRSSILLPSKKYGDDNGCRQRPNSSYHPNYTYIERVQYYTYLKIKVKRWQK